jgi:2-desacetyl-2-hydroxyethyl bacteriochlorophyllide A dehydrogenase
MKNKEAKRLVFTGKQQVDIEDFSVSSPGPGEVLVRTRLSLMSTGTENIVFNRLFDPGTHWDNWVKYPFYPGYASVGEVVESGDSDFPAGTRVTHRKGHCSHALLKAEECLPIPDSVPDEDAVWFALAKIGFHGTLVAQYHLGDTVLIIGAGPIGQMSVRWACATGASSILVADMAAARLELARAGGATAVIPHPIEEARAAILAANHNGLPRVVIDSTGNAVVFAAALGLAADHGRVVILGDTGQPTKQQLTMDVITRGLTIVGTHDNHNTPQWNASSIPRLFFDLASTGRFPLNGLNSHIFAPGACKDAYETANRDRSKTMGLVFDWR